MWDLRGGRGGDAEGLIASVESEPPPALPPTGTATQVRAPYTGHQQDATGCAFLPATAAGQTFATASKDGSLRVWDLVTGELLHERAEVRASAFTSLALVDAGAGAGGRPVLAASSYNAGLFSYAVQEGGGELLPLVHSAADPAAEARAMAS